MVEGSESKRREEEKTLRYMYTKRRGWKEDVEEKRR